MSETKIVLVTGAGSGIGRAVAEALGTAGHVVYAGIRDTASRNKERADDLAAFAKRDGADIRALELDVLSEASCRAAIDQILCEQGRIDVLVNNAGMLMIGVAEAFRPDQFATALDTNAIAWARVNRAALPAMRRQGAGTLVYISSTQAHIFEPFMAPYVAAKAAGEAIAEVTSFEVSRFGIDSVIVVPGAFTKGTEHFAHAHAPDDLAITAQYGDLSDVSGRMPERLDAIDAENGGAMDVSAVGEAVRDVLSKPRGERPPRIFVDAQKKGVEKGVEEMVALGRAKQAAFFEKLGIADLMSVPSGSR